MLVSFCSFCFISSVDSNRPFNFGDRKRSAGDRSGLEGDRERAGVPRPHGKLSDRRAPGARKRCRDDECAAFPPKVQTFTFALLVIDAAKRSGRILDLLRDLQVRPQNAPNLYSRKQQCT
jgi:hypothetical protein